MPSESPNPLALHGHLSYLEIPAPDPAASAQFFHAVFNWTIRQPEPHRVAFDDPAGNLIGRFVSRLAPTAPGMIPYIYTTHIEETVQKIIQHGGTIVRSIYPEGDLRIATFHDPAGNLFGTWQFTAT